MNKICINQYIIHVHNIHFCSKFKAQLLHFMCNKIYI